MINKIKQHKLAVLLFALLYMSNDTILFGTNRDNRFLYVQSLFLIVIFLFMLFKNYKSKGINKKSLFVLLVFIIVSMICMASKDIISFKYFYEILLLIIAVLFTNLFSFDEFKTEYINVMIVIAILSFIPFLINIFFQPLLNIFPTIHGKVYNFHNLFIGLVPHNKYLFNIYRNYSFFREPGIYGVFLNIGLILLLFSKNNKNVLKKTIILLLTIFSTLSTGTIFSSIIVLGVYTITQRFNVKKIMSFVSLIMIIIVVFTSNYINNTIMSKLFTDNGSKYSRIASLTSNINIGLTNPILGAGWERLENEFEQVSTENYGLALSHGEKAYHNTNTLMKLLAIHGIVYFAIYIYGLYKMFFKLNGNGFNSFLILLLFFIIVSYEDLTLNILMPLVFFYGIIKNDKITMDGENYNAYN